MHTNAAPLELPDSLRGIFFDGRWETRRIWALPTPVDSMRLTDLEWHLDLTVWSTVRGEPRFDLAPRTVLEHPERSARHWEKILSADTSFAIEMSRQGARWVVIDGYHRLARHRLDGNQDVPVRRHPDECWAAIRVKG